MVQELKRPFEHINEVIGRKLYNIQRDPVIPFLVKLDRKDKLRPTGRIIFARGEDTYRWLKTYGGRHSQWKVMLNGARLGFSQSKEQVDRFQLRAIKHANPVEVDSDYDEDGEEEKIAQPILNIKALQCGAFDENGQFCIGWSSAKAQSARAFISFDIDEVRLRIRTDDEIVDGQLYDLAYVYLSRDGTQIYFAFKHPPRFLRDNNDESGDENGEAWLDSQLCDYGRPGERFIRLSAFDDDHRRCAGYAVTYRVKVCDKTKVENFFEATRGRLFFKERINDQSDVVQDRFDVKKMMGFLQKLRYRVAFQAQALVAPHKLMPNDLIDLQSDLRDVDAQLDEASAAEAVRDLRHNTLERGPRLLNSQSKESTPLRILSDQLKKAKKRREGHKGAWPEGKTMLQIHTVNLTPCMALCLEGPHADEGNRILRQYKGYEDEFIRVRITDEDGSVLRPSQGSRKVDTHTLLDVNYGDIFKRVGVQVAGRRFYFLAYGNSGLRECICWFVRKFKIGEQRITADLIRKSIGDLDHIRNAARFAARMGQAFSSSSIVLMVKRGIVDIVDDVSTPNKRYDFTDGIGMVSPAILAQVNALILGRYPNMTPLSAFQIRFEGAKGMLAVNTLLQGEKIILRKSMVKFESLDRPELVPLEICNFWSSPLPVFLNRQIITLLETLGIPSETFLKLQSHAVDILQKATLDPTTATTLHKNNGLGRAANIQTLIKMLNAYGINAITDVPFLHDVNISFVNFALRRVKYAARISINDSYTMVGVVDETGVLRPNQVVVCLAYTDQTPRYLKGACLVGRSPMLAPGDIQRAVAVVPPEGHPLRALHNVIIFPQRGDRPLPSMLSGGDLDGDLYNVIQHPDILPIHFTTEPASYERAKIVQLNRSCEIDDVVEFFLDYMKLEKVGVTASLHLQIADQRRDGSLDIDCVQLAELHSISVDFAKTGIAPDMRSSPRGPSEKPDFMQKEYRLEDLRANVSRVKQHPRTHERFYRSNKALGLMFRAIDIYAQTEEWAKASEVYADLPSIEGEVGWSEKIWQCLERNDRHAEWKKEYTSMQAHVRRYDRTLDVIAQEHCPEDKMERLSEEEVFMGHVMCRGPHGTRLKPYDTTMRLQDDFEDLCRGIRSRVLLAPTKIEHDHRPMLEPLVRWLVVSIEAEVSRSTLRKTSNSIAARLALTPDRIVAEWIKFVRSAIPRGVAFIRAAFDSSKGRSAAWIMVPSVLLAHSILDELEQPSEKMQMDASEAKVIVR